MGAFFDDLLETQLLPTLGLNHTFINVPKVQMANYAFGYTKGNKPFA
jgi:beta-lactamase class C